MSKTTTEIAADCGIIAGEVPVLQEILDQSYAKDGYQVSTARVVIKLYRRIEALEGRITEQDDEARRLLLGWHREEEAYRARIAALEADNEALASTLTKREEQLGRLAGAVDHLVNPEA